ncbi:hypothetical protein HMPREF9108_01583 [Leptotrichia sp. oral taxon 225 str. F0581]|nr:hypothetical protein HMPREF9108_01583 [Leptotrichia sp. oral taxon 225 str. F0581]
MVGIFSTNLLYHIFLIFQSFLEKFSHSNYFILNSIKKIEIKFYSN